ncbi:hypothetical protein [Streptomyces rhizosphaerihabitans]|nr:hypothetical protein [Streptomyces rhizosphaerihabitans]MCT9008040.1 hypothetical protein [Streptomyces rhizosphaerihabitans]
MDTAGIVVVALAAALLGALGWYFFGPRRARTARLGEGLILICATA